MKKFLTIGLLFFASVLTAQPKTDAEKLTMTVKEFHLALVQQNTVSINQQTDKALTYGHSNGWVQTKTDLIKDFESGLISYESFTEDSISLAINNNLASVRFTADISAVLKGTKASHHLKVLEVWIKKGNRWVLFARQATKL
jgi:hypothetical protein